MPCNMDASCGWTSLSAFDRFGVDVLADGCFTVSRAACARTHARERTRLAAGSAEDDAFRWLKCYVVCVVWQC